MIAKRRQARYFKKAWMNIRLKVKFLTLRSGLPPLSKFSRKIQTIQSNFRTVLIAPFLTTIGTWGVGRPKTCGSGLFVKTQWTRLPDRPHVLCAETKSSTNSGVSCFEEFGMRSFNSMPYMVQVGAVLFASLLIFGSTSLASLQSDQGLSVSHQLIWSFQLPSARHLPRHHGTGLGTVGSFDTAIIGISLPFGSKADGRE